MEISKNEDKILNFKLFFFQIQEIYGEKKKRVIFKSTLFG